MRVEAYLFAGTAAFFAATDIGYAAYSHDPAGITALAVAFLMSSLISFYFGYLSRRLGPRPQDRGDADIAEGTGPVAFFSPHSRHPLYVAASAAVLALGIVFAAWLALMGFVLLMIALFGFVFQHATRD